MQEPTIDIHDKMILTFCSEIPNPANPAKPFVGLQIAVNNYPKDPMASYNEIQMVIATTKQLLTQMESYRNSLVNDKKVEIGEGKEKESAPVQFSEGSSPSGAPKSKE